MGGRFRCGRKAARSRRSPDKNDNDNKSGIEQLASYFGNGDKEKCTDLYRPRLNLGPQHALSWRSLKDRMSEWSQCPLRSGVSYNLDDLEIDELLGRGVHGSVHRGYVSGEIVAVKRAHEVCMENVLTSGFAAPPELELMDGIHHPNLVQIYGVHLVHRGWGDDLGSPRSGCYSSFDSYYFLSETTCDTKVWDLEGSQNSFRTVVVMEYCGSGNLWDAVRGGEFCVGKKLGVPDYRLIVEAGIEIALAMQHLHEHGIIHGDLKAKNVLLSSAKPRKNLVAKVGDYGLCRRLQHSRDAITTFTIGTVDHMPPETLRDGKLHKPTDVFSFGILLFEMITGRHPFLHMTPAAILVAIVEGMRPKLPANCPPDMVSLIRACWQQNWQYRPSFTTILGCLIHTVA